MAEKNFPGRPGISYNERADSQSDLSAGNATHGNDACRELNMSRNPIRTALKTLHAEGLVVRDYYKSIIVKEITDKDIEEIYQLRELLEGAAFREIFYKRQS